MPVADYTTYCQMLDRARTEKFAYPAVNVTSLTTANAVLSGLAESRSDGIIQVSTGGGAFASGTVGQGHGARRDLDRRARPPRRRTVSHPCRAAHRPLSGGQAGRVRDAARRGNRAAAGRRPAESLQRPHVRRQRAAAEGEPRHRGGASRALQQDDLSSKSKSAWWGARRTASAPVPRRSSTRRPKTRWRSRGA